jgi:carbamoyl-phosphate synthase large subunit
MARTRHGKSLIGKLLLPCAGRRVELLEMLRAASGMEVVAVDIDATAPALYRADAAFRIPQVGSDFCEAVLKLCLEQGVVLVVPTTDRELPAFADAQEQFSEEGIRIAVGSADGVRAALDKLEAAHRLGEAGLASVPTELWTACPPVFEFPLVVKPRAGSSGDGVRVLRHEKEWTEPPDEGKWIVQPLVSLPEITIDVVAAEGGRIVALGARERLKVRGGEVERARTVEATQFADIACRLSVAFALSGPFNFQVFGAGPKLLISDLNPRFGGGAPLSQHAGARLAECICEWGISGIWPGTEVALARPDVYMSRYDRSIFMTGDSLLWK